jgi:hypothetical protein
MLSVASWSGGVPPPWASRHPGLTDNLGSVKSNLDLAMKRAGEVRRELLTIVPDLAGNIQARGVRKNPAGQP